MTGQPAEGFVTQIGEAFVGDGANAAHLNTVLGAKGSPVETAWATSLATPTLGHARFVTVLRPGVPVKPATLFVPKADVRDERHQAMTWGAAQAGVASGVTDAVHDGIVDRALADHLLLIAAVWVDWVADDADAVFANNRAATFQALAAGAQGTPTVADVLADRERASNPFFRAGDG
jgi:5,6,7,8-tetrahydromethanopterin hydro-lyase